MRLSKLFSAVTLIGCALAIFTACSSDDTVIEENTSNAKHTVVMKLVGGCEGFDAKTTRAGETTYAWPNQARIYLRFNTSYGLVQGDAVYDSIANTWQVNYYGSLSTTTQSTCSASYFENPTSVTSTSVTLGSNSAIYEDANGTYAFDGDTLSVTATLIPKTSRIRFVGNSGTSIHVLGIKRYTSYNINSNSYTTTNNAVSAVIPRDADTTPYIYGNFTNTTTPILSIIDLDRNAYSLRCTNNMFQTGESGYINIPTENNRNGWDPCLIFNANGVDFKMISVKNGANSFFIEETEVTEGLYQAVTGGVTSTPDKAMSGVSYNTFISFINSLSNQVGLTFRLPTLDEWRYAANGGSDNAPFDYSGSNDVDAVAWYSGNTSSIQNVKQKQANGLGLYDMSGNVSEWTSTLQYSNWYHSYYRCGGNIASSASGVRVSVANSKQTDGDLTEDNTGIRLALTINY